METVKTTVLKTVSWRIIATAVTIGAVYAISGSVAGALSAGVADNVLKTATYYFHERMWARYEAHHIH